MDFSSEYIEMCTKAEEIQTLRQVDSPYQDGDWWLSRRWKDAVPCAWRAYRGIEDIWLPRQDQLQEMLGEFNLVGFWQQFFSYQSHVVEEEVGFELPEWAGSCDSWEQLWLTLVMWRKCNKEWHEGEWIVP